jgi:branched-chain amino acid transport system permease protein
MHSVDATPPSLNAATTAYEAQLWPLNKTLIFTITFILMLAGWSITDSYIGYLARLTTINVIVAYSLNLLIGYAGQAFIAIGATFAIGAYASALGMMKLGAPFVVAWPAGGIMAGIFGLLSSLPAMRLAGAYLAMVSIAFNVVVEQILIHWTELTGGPIGLPAIPTASIGGFELDDRAMLVLIIFVAALTIYGCMALRQSQWGRALAAMGENELASKSLGIHTLRLKAAVFWLSSVIAGLAGGLYAHSMRYISPDIGTIFASFNFIIMLVLGGIRSKWGPLVGAVLLTLLPQLLSGFERYHLLVLGIILLVVVTTMPRGVAQIVDSIVARFKSAPDRQDSTISQTLPATLSVARFGESIAPVGNHELVAEAIDRSFGGVAALRGASITVRSGMIRGLIGPNGSGKSTLVNVISGVDRANAGEIRFDGDRIDGLTSPRIANAGVIRSFQTPRIFCELTVMENLLVAQFRRHAASLFGAFFDLPSSRSVTREAAEQARRLARALGLEELLEQRAGNLSQGDKRKLEIARALAAEPSVLILDEPAAGLSAEEAATLCAVLEPLRAKGLAVILVEHHMDVIMRVCDRITVLERGSVIVEGTPEEVQGHPEVRRAYLGTQQHANLRKRKSLIHG